MDTSLHFSSAKSDWGTPQELVDKLSKIFPFVLDVCASEENKKCFYFISEEENAFETEWAQRCCWMNPPYGREIGKWVQRAYEQSRKHNNTIVCLLPARTDTRWWHDYCMRGEITFLKGRITFDGASAPAPFPSAIVVFRPSVSEVLNGN